MNFIDRHFNSNLQLLARNEGQIKSYGSCTDVRAWSHDTRRRDLYLKEWMKHDMPLCVVPVATLVGFFRTMTCRRRARGAACCHQECKSKVILDSITGSCNAIRECLKADDNLEKFFLEEELETSHWPCERYLEALKSIKLFWRIMLEKVFSINLIKNECFDDTTACCTSDSVREMARNWKKDMIYQAEFVKSITPELQAGSDTCLKKGSSICIPAPCSEGDTRKGCKSASTTKKCSPNCATKRFLESHSPSNAPKCCYRSKPCSSTTSLQKKCEKASSNSCLSKKCSSCKFIKKPQECPSKSTLQSICSKAYPLYSGTSTHKKCDADCPNISRAKCKITSSNCNLTKKCSSSYKKLSPCERSSNNKTHVCFDTCKSSRRSSVVGKCCCKSVEKNDASCGTDPYKPDSQSMKESLESLKQCYNLKKEEIGNLKKENSSLKCKLGNILYKGSKWKDVYSFTVADNYRSARVPQKLECFVKRSSSSSNLTKDAESELIITMKNCKNESFRHVHLLQVLHKSNDPSLLDNNLGAPCYKNEDPVQLLNKVQRTLGAIIKREMTLARQKKGGSASEIKASFQRVNERCKSAPSGSGCSSQ